MDCGLNFNVLIFGRKSIIIAIDHIKIKFSMNNSGEKSKFRPRNYHGQKTILLDRAIMKVLSLLKDPLYKTSFYVMLTSIAGAGFGFIFWIMAAKIYSPEDVGLATAIISAISLLVIISKMGFDQSIVRFFPDGDKNAIFSTSVIITLLCTLSAGIIFLIGLDFWAPGLQILKEIPELFLIVLLATAFITISGISFVALRRPEYYFAQSIVLGSRIVFLFPLIFLGTLGIFSAYGIAFLVGP